MSAGAARGETFMPSSMEYSEGGALSVFSGGFSIVAATVLVNEVNES